MGVSGPALSKRAKKIKLIAMDVDGVLTDGGIIVLESGEEVKVWNAKDRLGLAVLRDKKNLLFTAWITARTSKTVAASAEDLGINHLVQKSASKKEALEAILASHQLSFEQAAYIGDDLVDLGVMKQVGLAACPSDAVPDIKKICHYVSPLAGGRGVARDVLELILKAQGKWNDLVASFAR